MVILILIFINLMAMLGAPLFAVMAAFAAVGFYVTDVPLTALVVDVYNKFANNPILYTVPIFTFAGFVLAESKASVRIVNLSKALFGRLPGGLAIVSLIACAFFTAFTGASGVTIIALGGLLFPALIKEKYPERFSLGLLTSSGSLGLLFPPSLPIIIFGVVSETSITQLFAAGLIPGILLIALLAIYSVFIGNKSGVECVPFSVKEVFKTANAAKWELLIPLIIVVGIYGGFVTLGEIAAVTAAYVLIIETFIYKDIKF